ncbi:MAG: hypothetical protein ACOX6P_03290 [Candidatus Merdivicinus sp.]|jgi:hypothetical protein
MDQNTSTPQHQSVPLKNETWRLALQMFGNIVVCTILSLIISLSLSSLMASSVWGKLVVEILCLAVTLPIIYGYMWSQGDRDANFVQFGRMKKDTWKGLRAGFLGTIPCFLTLIPLALSMTRIIPFDFMPIYRLLNAPLWGFINMMHPNGGAIPHEAVPAQEATDTMPAIDAIPATDGLGWGIFVVLCLLPLIYVVFAAVGYYLGTKRFSITNKLIYKDDPNKIAEHRKRQLKKR